MTPHLTPALHITAQLMEGKADAWPARRRTYIEPFRMYGLSPLPPFAL